MKLWGCTVEEWRDVVGFEGRYKVSDEGRVRSVDCRVRLVVHGKETTRLSPGRILEPGRSNRHHLSVVIGKGNSRLVHQLVLEAFFVGPRAPWQTDVAHRDGNGFNNAFGNLRYATRTSNNQDRVWYGRTRLSVDAVRRIRVEAPAAPHGGKTALAKELGVSPSAVSDVLAGRTYSYV